MMVGSSRDARIVTSAERIVSLNIAAKKLLDISDDSQALGKNLMDFIHPDSNEAFQRKIDWLRTHGLPSGYTPQRLITPSGTTLEIDVSLELNPNKKDGEILLIARMSTLKKLQSAEPSAVPENVDQPPGANIELNAGDLIEAFINNAPDMIYFKNLDGVCINLNNVFTELTGYDSDECRQNPDLWKEIIHPDDWSVRKNFPAGCPTETESHTFEYRLKNKAGQWRWIQSRWATARDIAGQVIGYYFIDRDITARKNIVESLEESERKFRELAEKSLVGIYLIQEGIFKYVNPRLAEIFGYSREELIDRMGPKDVVHVEDYPQVEYNIARRIKGEASSIRHSFRCLTREGRKIEVEVFGSRTVHQGQPAVIGTLVDRTDQNRKHAVQQIIFQISQKSNDDISVESFLGFTRDKLNYIFNINNFYVALYDRSTQTYSCPYFEDKFDKNNSLSQEDFKRGLTDYVRRTGKALYADRQMQLKLQNRKEIDQVGTQSSVWMGVPLKIQGDVFGVIVIQEYDESETYTDEDFELMQYVAGHIATAIYRKQSDDLHAATNNLLKTALEQSPAGIVIADAPDIKLRLINRAAQEIRGETDLPLSDISLKDFTQNWKVFFPDGSICFPEELPLTKSIQTGETIYNTELIIERDNGEKRWISITSAPIKNSSGKIIAGIAVFPDITEHRRMEEQLKATNEQLIEDQKLLQEKNITLRELLSHIDREKEAIENQVQANIEKTVNPVLRALQVESDSDLKAKLEALTQSLASISSPFINKLHNQYSKLTPRELEICSLIKQGHISKEISQLLNISVETVNQQRKSIRRKLGLTNKNVNLRTFLDRAE